LEIRSSLEAAVSDFDGFVTGLRTCGTVLFEKTQPDSRTRQVFFFDPDGEGTRQVFFFDPDGEGIHSFSHRCLLLFEL
jgi:hypothetical protein